SAVARGETPVEVLLTPKPPQGGQVRGRVTDVNGQAIAATVRFTSSAGSIVDAELDGPGVYTIKLPAGDYTMDVVATGYLAKQRTVTVQAGQAQTLDLMLPKKPATSHVTLGKSEIIVKGTVHFGTNDA